MSGFSEYADAVRDEAEQFHRDVTAGLVEHRHPLTREQAADEARLQAERNERLADLSDNNNPESLWYA